MYRIPSLLAIIVLGFAARGRSESAPIDTTRGDRMIAAYFRVETARLRGGCLADVRSLDDWLAWRDESRHQLLEMLGLDPFPERTDLQATVTGTTEHEEFIVEKLHFQSKPGLYVTGNLYLPRDVKGKLPAILYVCGHGGVKKDGVSYGNKVHYHHHGSWFARNGYVCLTIDSLQLGEIEGIHHGTYRENMWWWLNRGYTPAGVEAWNCVRALDYLQSRDEVDPERLGVTGRSGGGAYSWWIAAIDDRIRCAVPVAGITDLQNHVVAGMPGRFQDGCVEGHCDCMYMLNTYRWDYAQVAALIAPRPLLISNTDRDGIFPLDGVYRIFKDVRRIYRLHDAADQVALHITAGGHADTQELRVHAFRWFNQYLRDDDGLIRQPAEKFFEPKQLKVFDSLPVDQRNSDIHESFVAVADSPLPGDSEAWGEMRDGWLETLRAKCFAAWPEKEGPLQTTDAFAAEHDGVALRALDFTSQGPIRLRLYIAARAGDKKPDLVVLNPLDEAGWTEFLAMMRPAFESVLREETLPDSNEEAFRQLRQMFASFNWAMVWLAPRGIGPTAWDQSERKQIQHRRRFLLLGQTLDGMRVWDVRRGIQALRADSGMQEVPLWLQSEGIMAGVTLYASLMEPDITRLDLYSLPVSHRNGPFLLNVRRFLDLPQTLAIAAERSQVVVYQVDEKGWDYPREVARKFGWEKGLRLRTLPPDTN